MVQKKQQADSSQQSRTKTKKTSAASAANTQAHNPTKNARATKTTSKKVSESKQDKKAPRQKKSTQALISRKPQNRDHLANLGHFLSEFRPTDTPFAGLSEVDPRPITSLPSTESTPEAAKRHVHDALILDGSARLNLATFVTTWMEPEAKELMAEAFDKNAIDHDEYESTSDIERRCVDIVANLFHAPFVSHQDATGVSTVGSSEAVMLAALAMKWRWRAHRREKKLSTDRPNLVLGANVQVVWEKFCRYFDVEPVYVPIQPGHYTIKPEDFAAAVDENTIGVVAIIGTTFTGEYEDIQGLSEALDEVSIKGGPDVPIHVDAASGGFVAPFLSPDLVWDFRVKRVVSINASGHKYGLVYPGVGWVVWRGPEYLPEDLVFRVNYLGGDMPTFTLNFSKSASQIIGQYYNFVRFGFEGYKRILSAMQAITVWLTDKFAEWEDVFEVVSDPTALPVVALTVKPNLGYDAYDISHELRLKGWQVPAYSMPENAEKVVVLRIVIRAGFSPILAGKFFQDCIAVVEFLEKEGGRGVKLERFAH